MDRQPEEDNNRGTLNINIPPSPNYKTNLMYFSKSGQNSLLISKKTIMAKIRNPDRPQFLPD